MILNLREIATILAALRYYQNDMDDGLRLSEAVDPEGELTKIATNDGAFHPLEASEIDNLCERLNFDGTHQELVTVLGNCLGSLEACEEILKPKTERARLSADIRAARELLAKIEKEATT